MAKLNVTATRHRAVIHDSDACRSIAKVVVAVCTTSNSHRCCVDPNIPAFSSLGLGNEIVPAVSWFAFGTATGHKIQPLGRHIVFVSRGRRLESRPSFAYQLGDSILNVHGLLVLSVRGAGPDFGPARVEPCPVGIGEQREPVT